MGKLKKNNSHFQPNPPQILKKITPTHSPKNLNRKMMKNSAVGKMKIFKDKISWMKIEMRKKVDNKGMVLKNLNKKLKKIRKSITKMRRMSKDLSKKVKLISILRKNL